MNLVAKAEFMKMSTSQEKAQCAFWFIETKSDIQAQGNFRRKYGRKPPARPTIQAWHKKFMRLVVCYRKRVVGDLCASGIYQKPHGASTQLQILRSIIHKVLRKNLRLYAYKVQLLQDLKSEDKPRRKEFAVTMLDRLDSDPGFLKHVCFGDESTFHFSGLLNRYSLRI